MQFCDFSVFVFCFVLQGELGCYVNMANVMYSLARNEEAVLLHNRALLMLRVLNRPEMEATIQMNLGNVYERLCQGW